MAAIFNHIHKQATNRRYSIPWPITGVFWTYIFCQARTVSKCKHSKKLVLMSTLCSTKITLSVNICRSIKASLALKNYKMGGLSLKSHFQQITKSNLSTSPVHRIYYTRATLIWCLKNVVYHGFLLQSQLIPKVSNFFGHKLACIHILVKQFYNYMCTIETWWFYLNRQDNSMAMI